MKKEAEAKKVVFFCYIGLYVHAYASTSIKPLLPQITSTMASRAPASLFPCPLLCHYMHNWHLYLIKLNLQATEDREVAKRLEEVQQLPKGQKKDYGAEMLKGYDPQYVEAAT